MKQYQVYLEERELNKLKYRLNTDKNYVAIQFAVALCANMNRADFNQFISVYHNQVNKKIKKNVERHAKFKRFHGKIENKGGLDAIILAKILGWRLQDIADYFGVTKSNLINYLKTRNLKWTTLIENENEIIYKGKFGTLTSKGGNVKFPKKKKKRKKKQYKKKSVKKDRHRKYYRVTKHRNKACKQGFKWRYTYKKKGKKQTIEHLDLNELERLVKLKGLPWRKLPLYDGEVLKNEEEVSYDEYSEFLQ